MQTKKMESAIKETNELLNLRKLPSRSERNSKMNRKVVNNISMRFAYLFVLLLLIFSLLLTYLFKSGAT